MHRFITFTKNPTSSNSPLYGITSVDLAQIIGFEVSEFQGVDHRNGIIIHFYTAHYAEKHKPFSFVIECKSSEEIVKGMNQKIFEFWKDEKVPILDLNAAFADVSKGHG
ncbi:hypothetical protein R83H12_00403 [Fibrobacteria bacterium R8-3-H12]